MTAPPGWIALPTISPQKADFALINETVDFTPSQAVGAMQRNAPGWQRWRLSLSYESLAQDEQAQMKAFLAAVEGGYFSFMVEVGRMTPWRGSMDAFNRIQDKSAQCDVSSGVEAGAGGVMQPSVDHGRLRFDKKGGYNAYDYYPNSDNNNRTSTQSLELYRPYAVRVDMSQSPTNVNTTNYRSIFDSVPNSYMTANKNFYSGPSLSYINSRCITPFIATNTVGRLDLHWDQNGLPGDSWWVDNIYLGAVALVDNGQNLCPFAYTMSGWTFNASTLTNVPPVGVDGFGLWLEGITFAGRIRCAATSATHYANVGLGATCKVGSWGMASNNLQPWLTYTAFTRDGIDNNAFDQVRMDIIDNGGGSIVGYAHVDSTGMAVPALVDFEYGRQYFDELSGGGVANWVRAGVGARISSRTSVSLEYLMVNTNGASAFDATVTSGTIHFMQQALHGNVWRASSYCLPDNFADVPGRWVPTSTSIVVSGTLQSGNQMYLKGLPSSMSQAARAGDWLTLVNGELKKLTTDLNTDGFGLALAQFQPAIFTPPAHLNPVFFGPGAYGRFRLVSPPQWSLRPGYYADLKLDLEEVYEG